MSYYTERVFYNTELGEYLHNISRACKIHSVSKQHFYDIRCPDQHLS